MWPAAQEAKVFTRSRLRFWGKCYPVACSGFSFSFVFIKQRPGKWHCLSDGNETRHWSYEFWERCILTVSPSWYAVRLILEQRLAWIDIVRRAKYRLARWKAFVISLQRAQTSERSGPRVLPAPLSLPTWFFAVLPLHPASPLILPGGGRTSFPHLGPMFVWRPQGDLAQDWPLPLPPPSELYWDLQEKIWGFLQAFNSEVFWKTVILFVPCCMLWLLQTPAWLFSASFA